MKVHSTEAYFTRQHEACCKYLKRYARKPNADDLHSMRVSIKKIKAILNLTTDLHGLDVEGYFAPYRGIFHQAGQIRKAALVHDKLKELSKDKKAIADRGRHITALNKKFKTEIPFCLKDVNERVEDVLAAIRSYDYDTEAYCKKLIPKLKKNGARACITTTHSVNT
ncbi:MAG: hypothetical protein JWO03_2276 [Bacteroidetes bacterium]|nr:hypothetical protein [Bacteroidota bacterium]